MSFIFFTYCSVVVSRSVVFVFFLLYLKFCLWRVRVFVQGFSSLDPFFQLLPFYVSAVISFPENRFWLCTRSCFFHLFPRFSSSVLLLIKPGILCWNFWQIFSLLFLYINTTMNQDTPVYKPVRSAYSRTFYFQPHIDSSLRQILQIGPGAKNFQSWILNNYECRTGLTLGVLFS